MRNILSCAAKLFLFNGCVTVPEGSHASLSTSRAFDAGFDRVWNTRRSLVAASVIHKDFDGLTSRSILWHQGSLPASGRRWLSFFFLPEEFTNFVQFCS
jgi:hypothetical protein